MEGGIHCVHYATLGALHVYIRCIMAHCVHYVHYCTQYTLHAYITCIMARCVHYVHCYVLYITFIMACYVHYMLYPYYQYHYMICSVMFRPPAGLSGRWRKAT